jgi:hydroxymethylpyrimidine pyrophosphatase-like HAD family hydrolase
MSLLPLSQAPDRLRTVRLIATDIDGTLTTHGKFTPNVLQALTNLAQAGITVVLVTGRSAGWVSGLAYPDKQQSVE